MHLTCCGAGEAVLFIHGMPTNGRLWNEIIKRLCGSYRCFTVDLPGLGKSPRIGYGPGYLQGLAAQIEALRIEHGIAKWHVVGHDAGSAVAVHYAHQFQENVGCMALLAPALFPELKPYFLIEPLRKPVVGELLAPVIETMFWKIAMRRALRDCENRDAIVEDFHAPFAGFAGAWEFMQVLRWGKPAQMLADVPHMLPELKMPTLIFYGSDDVAIPRGFAERASSLIPKAKMVKVESGHFLPLERPEVIASGLAQLFAGQTAGLQN